MMPEKDPSESVVVEFDFTGELSGITSAVVTATVHSGGTDPDPNNIVYGAPQLDGKYVQQRIYNGLSGVVYKLRCVATNGSDTIVREALLPVKYQFGAA